jgi:hypothetical protein
VRAEGPQGGSAHRHGAIRAGVGWLLLAGAVAAALAVRAQAPWVPDAYLAALVALGCVAWRVRRWTVGRPLVRWPAAAVVTLSLAALMPVPWLEAALDHPPGTAWRLDGRLEIKGEVADPEGRWYWLTAGRPPLVAEVVRSWVTGDAPAGTSLRDGRATRRPRINEPAAAVVGLRAAGWLIDSTVVVELARPTRPDLPGPVVVSTLNAIDVRAPGGWEAALDGLRPSGNVFTTDDGEIHRFRGAWIPYESVEVLELPTTGLEVAVGGRFASTPLGAWTRNLAVGRSHGLMVALVSYAHASGGDLAPGASVAGTGSIGRDGVVGRIGGLRSKAGAARAAGADVLLFPAEQAEDLDGFEPGTMELVPVSTLAEAIAALSGRPGA